MAVVLATSVAAEVWPRGGTVHSVVRDELGIWIRQLHQHCSESSDAYPWYKVGRILVLEVPDGSLDVSHTQLASVGDRDSQVLAEGGVDSCEKRFSLEQGSGQCRDVRCLEI